MVKLDIGSGPNPIAGYLGVDAYADTDIQSDMWDLPFGSGSVTAIYSSHALEHILKSQVMPTLREWHRVLMPGGIVEIQVPSLVWVCQNWLKHQTNDWHLDAIFGNQEHAGQVHKTGFTPQLLEDYVRRAGFRVLEQSVIWSHSQETLVIRAVKP